MRRFYIPPEQMGKKESFITGPDAHHLRDVLRLQPDDLITVFDGSGCQFQAKIISFHRQKIKVAILTSVQTDVEPMMRLAIAQGYLKDKKMDGLVRQLTEIGVDRWIPFLSGRSIPAPSQDRLKARYSRWNKISIAALKQCGRNRAMEIDSLMTFSEVLKQAGDYDLKIIFWEESRSSTLPDKIWYAQPASVFLMIGPEGGFGADEVSLAKDEGFNCIGLGPRILRAETASLAAAIVAQFVFGDMR